MNRYWILDILLILIYSVVIILMTIFVKQDYIIIITAISIFIIDKILIPKRKDIAKKESLKKNKQKLFNLLTKLSMLCIERRIEKDNRKINRDTKIYTLISRLFKFGDALDAMNIVFNKEKKRSTFFQTIVIEEKLHLDANVDPSNSRVWYATIYLTGKHNEHPTRNELIDRVYPILDSLRGKNKLKWDKETENFFKLE